MTHRNILLVLLFIAIPLALAAPLRGEAAPDDDLQRFPACKHCRMNRAYCTFTRTLVAYTDGTESALCSIHCLAIDLVLNTDKTPNSIKVAEYNSKDLIDAETATWVLGGLKKGVMTERGKWAFRTKKQAEEFVERNGGAIVSFEKALEETYHDMYNDSKSIRNRRKIKMLIKEFEHRSSLPPPGMISLARRNYE